MQRKMDAYERQRHVAINVMDMRALPIPGLMRTSWITEQWHTAAKAAIITGL